MKQHLPGDSPLSVYGNRSLRDGLKREVTSHELITGYMLHLGFDLCADVLSEWAPSAEPAPAWR